MSQLSSLIGFSHVNNNKPKSVDELTCATSTLLPSSTDTSSGKTCDLKLTEKKSIVNNTSFPNEVSLDFPVNKPSTTSSTGTLTATGLTSIANTIKPILKSSSSLISNHSRHKRCSSLGHTIRYIDETSVQLSLVSSPLVSSTCPSTPNAFTNVPTPAFSAFQLKIGSSTPPTSTSQQQSSNIKPCEYCQLESGENCNQFNNYIPSNNEPGRLWTCQQSYNNSTLTPLTTTGSSNFSYNSLFDQQQQQQRNYFSPSNQHSCHFANSQGYSQCSSTEPNASLLPTLASIESVSYPNSDNQSHLKPPKLHHYHHHHNHNHHHNDPVDRQSLYSIHMEKDFRYFFQHPYARLLVAYSVIACNFLIFAEDPISHSHTECGLPIVGNVISFVFTKYPPETVWKIIKVLLWLTALAVGMAIGKYLFHHVLLRKVLRLKMFRDEEGTWMIMILITFICTYMFSLLYNLLLLSVHPNPHPYLITTKMGVTNASFMKVAACGTWLGDFFTAWVVTDMMLQDELYPGWAKSLRTFWIRHGYIRIIIFWAGSIGVSSLVVYLIGSDEISWDNLNHNYVNTTELTRAFLASMILVMDLLVVMQDWDFPHFVCDMDIKLPGLKQASYSFKIFTIKKTLSLPETFVFHITGKWFNYGIIIVVMMLDLNMWKNQIIYYPPDFGQYTGPDSRVYTVADEAILNTGNSSLWSYAFRVSTIDPKTNRSLLEGDLVVNSRYLGYTIYVKSLAFLPCAAGFILFFTLIYQYGRFPPKTDASYGGRLKKRKSTSSWRRERRDSRHGYISWKGITTYEEEANAFRRQIERNSNV